MNKSKEFLKGKLKGVYGKFKGVKIRYEFREYMDLHLIEILPLDTFENNQAFVLEEIEIQEEFENLFGEDEEVLFISSESLNQIENSEFSLGYETVEKIELFELIDHYFMFDEFIENIPQSSPTYALAA